jgi:hypothetical protein
VGSGTRTHQSLEHLLKLLDAHVHVLDHPPIELRGGDVAVRALLLED